MSLFPRQTEDYYDEEEYIEEQNLSDDDESAQFDPNKLTSRYHLQKAEKALQSLKLITTKDSKWKKILQHKSGVSIYSKSGGDDDKLPIFMGEHIIEGFAPQAIFAVIGMRKLWDDWYEEGSLIENLNDTTSLTYMVMQAMAGSKVRDLSLVEKIECAQNGTIYFVSTSVETKKVSHVPNRIRAHIVLNGWILEPESYDPPRTKAVYVLQTKIRGWVPSILSKTYLARRPLVLHTIEQYLRKNGPPPMVISSTPPESIRSSSTFQAKTKFRSMDLKSPRRKHSLSYLNGTNSSNSTSHTSPFFPHDDPYTPKSSSSSALSSPPAVQSPMRSPPTRSSPTRPPPTRPPPITVNTEKVLSWLKNTTKSTLHRHTTSVQKAFEKFKSHLPMDNWDFYSENNGLKIYMKEIDGKSTPIMRGDGVISGGFTTCDILSVIKNLDMRKLWDDRYDEGKVYEMFSPSERLSRTVMKGTFPISGRDMSVCEMLDYDEDSKILQFITTSVVDPLIPESKKLVRAHLDFAGWLLKPNIDSDENTISVDIIYIVDVDVKLDTIPSSIRKTLSIQIPTIVNKLNELVQKMGFPPYVLNSTMKVLKEEFSVKNNQYDLSLITEDNGVTELKISKLMYPNGVDVSTIPENCKVERLSDHSISEIIRITLPRRIDLDNLMITITKYSSNGFQLTHNHSRTIKLASNSDSSGKKSKQSKHTAKSSENTIRSEHNTKSENATFITNGTINGHLIDIASDLQKHKTRSGFSPETFVKPSEVSLNGESTYQRTFDKQTLLENKIAAVTREVQEDQEVQEVQEDQEVQEVQEDQEDQNSSDSSSDPPSSDLSSEDTPQTEESIVEKIKNGVMESAGDLTIVTDSIRLNSRQVGLMFASMLLAYYAGKLSI